MKNKVIKNSPNSVVCDTQTTSPENNELFKLVFDCSNVGKSITSLNGEFNVNNAFCNLLGYNKHELQNINWQKITHPDDIEITQNEINKIKTGKVDQVRFNKRFIHKNGSIIWADVSSSAMLNKNGELQNLITTIVDITERKKAEGKLEESKNLFNSLYKAIPIPTYTWKAIENDFVLIEFNDAAYKITNGKISEFAGNKASVMYRDNHGIIESLNKCLYEKNSFENEIYYSFISLKQNKYFNVKYAFAQPDLVIVHTEDITERKLAEKKLKESESRFKNMFENHSSIMLLIEPESGNIINANKSASSYYGYSISELCLKSINDINILTPEKIKEERTKALNDDRNYFLFDHKLASGEIRKVEVHSSSIEYANKHILFSIIHDITIRKNTEKKLKESELKYRSLIENTNDVVFCVDEKGEYKFTNQVFAKTFGKTPDYFIGKTFWDIYPKEEADYRFAAVKELFRTGETQTIEVSVPLPDRTLYFLAKANPIKDETGKVILNLTTAIDITERKLAEQKIKQSEETYRTLFEGINDAVLISEFIDETKTSKFIEVNDIACNRYGYTREELLNLTPADINSEKTKQLLPSLLKNISDKKHAIIEVEHVAKDGRIIPVEISTNIIQYKNKTVFQSIARNITERKIVEAKTREKDIEFRKLSANVPDLIYQFTRKPDGSYCVPIASEGIKNIFGCSPEDVLNDFTPIAKVIYPEDSERVINDIEYSAKHLTYFTCEFRVQIPGKEIQWIYSRSNPEKLPDGSITWYGFNVDITAQKTAQQEISIFSQRLALATTSGKLGVWDWNVKDNIMIWDDRMFELYGIKHHTFPNNVDAWTNGLHPEDKQRAIDECNLALNGDQEYHTVFRVLHPNGTILFLKADAIVIKNDEGNTIRMIGINKDITEQKLAEIELKKAKEKAEESDRLKSAFLANMSHEIRTPMNGILGFTDLLKTPNLPGEKQQEFIGIIENSGKRMLNLINDIVNISKVEAGMVEVNISTSNANEQTDYIYNFFKLEAQTKGIKLILKNGLSPNDAQFSTDREKVFAILTNLVKNAIKFTNKGFIEIGYIRKNEFLQFYVKDTGTGISYEKREIIFERFRQGSEDASRGYEGAGLGLSISKAYVEMLGGKIWVESIIDKGSTFYFTVPYNNAQNKNVVDIVTESEQNNKIKNLKILLVEDDPAAEQIITIMVEQYDNQIFIARDGEEAVHSCFSNPEINLILMDIKIPKLNGYEATKRIREFNKNVIIIAQTAYALAGDREKAIEAGCNDYISKPYSKAALYELIEKYF